MATIASYLLLVFSLLWAALTVWLAWRLQWSGPFRDLWEVMPLIEKAFQGDWYWLDFWAAYGGAHRLVIPRFLFVLEYRFFGGENRFILLISLACQSLTALLLWLRLRQTWPQQPVVQALGLACLLLTLFCATQLFNFNYSYDTQWFQAMLFSVMALLLATSPRLEQAPLRYLIGIAITALLASLSNMAGLLVWPVLAALTLTHRISQIWRCLFAIWALAALSLFMTGIEGDDFQRTPSDASLLQWLAWCLMSAARMLHFTALYLGSPLTRHWPWVGSMLALLLTLGVLWDGWRAARCHQEPCRPLRLLCASLVLQVWLIGLATAWGRIFYPASMALAERYQTAILMAWLAMALSALAWLHRHGWHKTRILIPLLLACGLLTDHYRSSINAIHLSQSVHNAHLAAALGITDMSIARQSLSFPAINNSHNYLARHNAFLRQHGLAYFREPALARIGQPLEASEIRVDCQLAIHRTQVVVGHDAALNVSGEFHCEGRQPDIIALLNEHDTVIGLALPLGPWIQADVWMGYLRGDFQSLRAIAFTPEAFSR